MGEDREKIAENESSQEKLCKRQMSVTNTGNPVWEEFPRALSIGIHGGGGVFTLRSEQWSGLLRWN